MPKSIWKGDISFGLVTIPISLTSIEESHDIHFHLLNAKTKNRINYQRVDKDTGQSVPWEQIVKGYEYEKGNYIVVNEEAFEKAAPALFKSITIEEFVSLNEIDILYYSKPYYLMPEGKNKKAYVLLREALLKTKQVGVARAILRTKEHLCLILPHNNALVLYFLRYSQEIRSEEELGLKEMLSNYSIGNKELEMAIHLIKDMHATWEPEKYHNHYQEILRKWLDKQVNEHSKKDGRKTVQKIKKQEAVDFVALLKESMGKNKSKLSFSDVQKKIISKKSKSKKHKDVG